jgi:hypothetical protein
MTQSKKKIVITGILLAAMALGIGGYVYYRIVARRVGEQIAEELMKPRALPGVDTQLWAQIKVGMTKEQVQTLLGDAPSKSKCEYPSGGKHPEEELSKTEFWEWGFTYGLLAPVPHEKAFVVYFDHDGRVSSFRAPQVAD